MFSQLPSGAIVKSVLSLLWVSTCHTYQWLRHSPCHPSRTRKYVRIGFHRSAFTASWNFSPRVVPPFWIAKFMFMLAAIESDSHVLQALIFLWFVITLSFRRPIIFLAYVKAVHTSVHIQVIVSYSPYKTAILNYLSVFLLFKWISYLPKEFHYIHFTIYPSFHLYLSALCQYFFNPIHFSNEICVRLW